MKKLCRFLCLAAIVAFVPQLAAQEANYGVYDGKKGAWQIQHGGGSGNEGCFLALDKGEPVSLTIDIIKNTTGGTLTFGTFSYDDSGNLVLSDAIAGGVGEPSYSVGYEKDKVVGLWVDVLKDGEVTRCYSTGFDPATGEQNSGVGRYTGTRKYTEEGTAYIWFDALQGNKNGKGEHAAIKLKIGGKAAPASSGAPLPGVLATVGLCGAVGGYLRRKKSTAPPARE